MSARRTPQEKRIRRKYGSGAAMDRIFLLKILARRIAIPAPKMVSRIWKAEYGDGEVMGQAVMRRTGSRNIYMKSKPSFKIKSIRENIVF